MKEVSLPTTAEAVVGALKAAALRKDWDQVDALAPLAAKMNGDELVAVLYRSTRDTSDDIRDAAMTAWSFLEPTTDEKRTAHFQRALNVMKADYHECSAIWAAATVVRYVDDERFGREARGALSEFKRRIGLMDRNERGEDWQETRNFVVGKNRERLPQLAKFI